MSNFGKISRKELNQKVNEDLNKIDLLKETVTAHSAEYTQFKGDTETEIDNLKSSVSNGKSLVATAITDQGVPTSSDAAFQTMANNIGLLGGGIKSIQNGYTTMSTELTKDVSMDTVNPSASVVFLNNISLPDSNIGSATSAVMAEIKNSNTLTFSKEMTVNNRLIHISYTVVEFEESAIKSFQKGIYATGGHLIGAGIPINNINPNNSIVWITHKYFTDNNNDNSVANFGVSYYLNSDEIYIVKSMGEKTLSYFVVEFKE
ncbi:hypothetical protein PQ478_08355 [Alkalihalophilus pseudofirmus]|uniref:hypothetical protein n=1 Tax=Alkalihalophilus pseudofirmus TaxID=79885 RepID=UPI00259B2F44|nr:hypothetical protein [Alkalihalophilus pseudofirmus]WEG18480.1 hypothetical protein PQ478_08355 [Alkalihalophilus pseudofirmus]